MAGGELVECIDERRCSGPREYPTEGSRQPELREQHYAPAAVPGNRPSVTKDEPPALSALLLGHGGQQPAGFRVPERKEGELLAPVERGGDPRRPAAEPSPAVIEENGAPKAIARRGAGIGALCHSESLEPAEAPARGPPPLLSGRGDQRVLITPHASRPPASPVARDVASGSGSYRSVGMLA